MSEEVLALVDGAVGRISLNRPRALHALTTRMVKTITNALLCWRGRTDIQAVLIDHSAEPDDDAKRSRGFCAGGDINLLRRSAIEDNGREGRRFFFDEYRLNHLLYMYESGFGGQPIVAFMDGVTMGGGVGISQPARFRVATENTRLAMPESGIGLFPDVGGGWYLSRLAGRLGQYLALTGARLDGAECMWAGLASHYLPAEQIEVAKARLVFGETPENVLGDLSVNPPEPALARYAGDIERLFASDQLDEIIATTAAEGGAFAASILDKLRAKSPTSCKVALRQLATSLKLPDFAANMAMEYRLAARVLVMPDFAEGVRAMIVDKDNAPLWSPSTSEAVSPATLDAIFNHLPQHEEWTPL
ncbi:enoyl-CoA hydratase/isomerase family protein [Novosphingobium piscinae]|uniref:3-hydroxyisobutyryl-CoA hydrolase n=1 Tax=Novosphingobium piscinae TaxID=1507448 RepID=A0A7X1FZ15_9SPHN|nr:enoyl-CoA hydratase/isomerase family protein [Novosphingobium piscinae]